jgi:hypothetical protein
VAVTNPQFAHPEIDEFLARADEVLEECPGPTTLDPSTGTPSGPRAGRSGAVAHGQKKSKPRTVKDGDGRAA